MAGNSPGFARSTAASDQWVRGRSRVSDITRVASPMDTITSRRCASALARHSPAASSRWYSSSAVIHAGLLCLVGMTIARPPPARQSFSGSSLAERLAKLEFLDLAGRGFGQFLEHHLLGAFEPGQLFAGKADQVCLACLDAVLELDKGAGHLAPFLIRHGDHGTEQNRGVLHQRALDLDGTDVLAA